MIDPASAERLLDDYVTHPEVRFKDIKELLLQLFKKFPKERPAGLSDDEAVIAYYKAHIQGYTVGVRPLAREPGASSLQISRDHRLVKEGNFWSIAGVKLTAGRAAGEEVARNVFEYLTGKPAPKSIDLGPLPGGEMEDFEAFVRQQTAENATRWDADTIRYLASMYGTRLSEILDIAESYSSLAQPVLVGEKPWLLAEAAFAARYEMVLTLNDFLWRRTKWAYQRNLPEEAVRRVAAALGRELKWSPEQLEKQIADYYRELALHARLPPHPAEPAEAVGAAQLNRLTGHIGNFASLKDQIPQGQDLLDDHRDLPPQLQYLLEITAFLLTGSRPRSEILTFLEHYLENYNQRPEAGSLKNPRVDIEDLVSLVVSVPLDDTNFLLTLIEGIFGMPPPFGDRCAAYQLIVQALHAIDYESGTGGEHYDVLSVARLLDYCLNRVKAGDSESADEMRLGIAMSMVFYAEFREIRDVLQKHRGIDVVRLFDEALEKDSIGLIGARQLGGTAMANVQASKPFSHFFRRTWSGDAGEIKAFREAARSAGIQFADPPTSKRPRTFRDDRSRETFTADDVRDFIRDSQSAHAAAPVNENRIDNADLHEHIEAELNRALIPGPNPLGDESHQRLLRLRPILYELLREYGSLEALKGLKGIELGPATLIEMIEFLRRHGVSMEGVGGRLTGTHKPYLHPTFDYNDFFQHVPSGSFDFMAARLAFYPRWLNPAKLHNIVRALREGGILISQTYIGESSLRFTEQELLDYGLGIVPGTEYVIDRATAMVVYRKKAGVVSGTIRPHDRGLEESP